MKLDEIIATNPGGLRPQYPGRPPWAQPSGRDVTVAITGNVVSVPLKVADRVRVRGLDRALAYGLVDAEPIYEDMTRQSWGLPAA